MAEADPGPDAGPGPNAPAPPSRARTRTAVLAVLLLAGAAACAGAAALTWWTADFIDSLTGPLTLRASGADCLPELVPVALIALAGFGATLATQGWLRRVVGVVLLAGGLLVAVRAALAMTRAPAVLTGSLGRPADPTGPAQLHPWGPLLALAGGVLIAVAGALVAAGLGGRRRLGARYDAPTAARPAAVPGAASDAAGPAAPMSARGSAPGDAPDAGVGTGAGTGVGTGVGTGSGTAAGGDGPGSIDVGDWWKALDAGDDPTVARGSDSGGYHER